MGLTTAQFLTDPERGFAIANQLKVPVEIYPTLPPKLVVILREMSRKTGLSLPIPPALTPSYLDQLQDKYPDVEIARVHLEFNYNLYESFQRILIGERGNGLKQHVFQVVWRVLFATADNLHGIKLASHLRAGVNAHPDVVYGFARDGKLGAVREQLGPGLLLVENERRHHCPNIPHKELLDNPIRMTNCFVREHRLADGVLLGLDHLRGSQHPRLEEILQHRLIRRYTRAMHLAQTGHHPLVLENEGADAWLRQIAATPFRHPVEAYLDYAPQLLARSSIQNQADLLKRQIEWIMDTQHGASVG